MFTDPQTFVVSTVEKSLPRISTEGSQSLYSTADEAFKMRISHQESKGRTRHMVRIDQRVVAPNPLTAVNEYKTLGVYLVIDEPEYGFTDAEIVNVWAALSMWALSTGEDFANVLKVLGGES